MPCVRKRREKWVIDFYDQFGKRHWETVGTNKKDAEEELAKRLLAVGKNAYCPQNKTRTLGEVAEEWFTTQVVPNKRPKTTSYYRNHLDNHLLPYFINNKLSRIDVGIIERYMAYKLKENGIGKASINKTVTTLGTILKYAIRHKFCESNPVSSAQKLNIGHEELLEDDKLFFTPDEIHLLLENQDPKYGPFIMTDVMTGM
jgi:integrase